MRNPHTRWYSARRERSVDPFHWSSSVGSVSPPPTSGTSLTTALAYELSTEEALPADAHDIPVDAARPRRREPRDGLGDVDRQSALRERVEAAADLACGERHRRR